jgi:hypothetical protein
MQQFYVAGIMTAGLIAGFLVIAVASLGASVLGLILVWAPFLLMLLATYEVLNGILLVIKGLAAAAGYIGGTLAQTIQNPQSNFQQVNAAGMAQFNKTWAVPLGTTEYSLTGMLSHDLSKKLTGFASGASDYAHDPKGSQGAVPGFFRGDWMEHLSDLMAKKMGATLQNAPLRATAVIDGQQVYQNGLFQQSLSDLSTGNSPSAKPWWQP